MLGGWHGNEKGACQTIEAFDHEQDVTFAHDGRPFSCTTSLVVARRGR